MKYLTKEWFKRYQQNFFGGNFLRVNKNAAQYDEKLFQRLYRKVEKTFVINSQLSIMKEEDYEKVLKMIDEIVNNPKAGDEERRKLEQFRILYEKEYEQFKEEREIYENSFDLEKAKRAFAGWYSERLEIVEGFPIEILSRIADKRVVALGYTTCEIRKKIKAFLLEQSKETDLIWSKALDMVDDAEKYMEKPAGLNENATGILYGIRKVKDGILLKFRDIEDLRVINGAVVKQEQPLYRFVGGVHNEPMTLMMGKELEYIDGKYRLSMLMNNIDECERTTIWEMVVEGDNLRWQK